MMIQEIYNTIGNTRLISRKMTMMMVVKMVVVVMRILIIMLKHRFRAHWVLI